jgi:uncharacterized protein (TIGR00375 family)
MKFVADLHIHSKYSRATSSQMDLENLAKWAVIKGIKVMGTGDFTHPQWLEELKTKLEPAEPGLFKLKNSDNPTRFMLTSEISCIYSKNQRVRKIHIIVFAPSFEAVDKINAQLSWIGNLKADGRPILGLDAKELVKIVLNTCQDCFVVPAHCLLPDTYLHTSQGIKMIKNIKVGDKVYTHKGRVKKVKEVLTRPYKGVVYTIKPFYFRLGLTTTPEHPYLVLRNDRSESNYYGEQLKRDYFKDKKPQWVRAEQIKKGDILLFPRFNRVKDVETLEIDKVLNPIKAQYVAEKIAPLGSRINWIPALINVDKGFCRLVGYYLSEGYLSGGQRRDAIGFSFKSEEEEYIKDVRVLMKKIFGLEAAQIYKKEGSKGIEIIYFSKILNNVFGHLFYRSSEVKRASTKAMPNWMLELPLEKQVEIFRGWWRGDRGYTSSRLLMNQIKTILLRLGILPSIYIDSKESHKQRGKHLLGKRIISAQHDNFSIINLSFFEDKFDLLKEPEFQKFNYKTVRRIGWIDKHYAYLPVFDIEKSYYQGDVYNLEVEEDNSYITEFATVHNCWTPWFSLFGSRSGFDSMEECFEEYTKYIYALETGLSSDPANNWRLSALDKITLISNSDSHSPAKIGREANVFNTQVSYPAIVGTIKSKDPQRFLYTIEFFPQEGKYHYDGHRNCGVSYSPKESKKTGGICPVCGRPLTIGVLNRVEELADREEGFVPPNAIPFKSLIPLQEIIAEAMGAGVGTKGVELEYNRLVKNFGNELNILLNVSRQELEAVTLSEIAEGIIRVREGRVFIQPGYDGVYGKVGIFSQAEKKETKQKTLF